MNENDNDCTKFNIANKKKRLYISLVTAMFKFTNSSCTTFIIAYSHTTLHFAGIHKEHVNMTQKEAM